MAPGQAMLARLQRYQPTRALSREFYTSIDDYHLELDAIWYRDWLFVAHGCELPREGDFLTVQVGAYPLLIVRNGTEIQAFHNACRHRGSRICAAQRGSASQFECPAHHWVYDVGGRLLAPRIAGGDLKRIHCMQAGGHIFICLGAAAPEFGPFRQEAERYLLPHHLRDAKVACQSTIVEHANWKLVWENNRECYHCAANHPELCRTYPSTPTVVSIAAASSNPGVDAQWERWEAQGLASRFVLAPNGQSRLVRMPLLGDAVSFTMDGTAAVRRRLSDAVADSNPGSLLMFHYPSTWNHVLADHAITFRVLPLSPTETQLTTTWLVHQDAREGADYEIERLTEVWRSTNEEDRRVCQENQLGVNSPSYEPAPYSPIHEAGSMQFAHWYREHLLARLQESSLPGG